MNAQVLVALIVPVGGSVNSSLFVISCHHFPEKKNGYLVELFETCIIYFFSIECYD
jgi:hypothetical protein